MSRVPGKVTVIKQSKMPGRAYLRWQDGGLNYGLPVSASLVEGLYVGDDVIVEVHGSHIKRVQKVVPEVKKTPMPENSTTVRYAVVTNRYGDLKELDDYGSESAAGVDRNWWINSCPDPKDAEGEFFIVKKTVTVTYEEI